MSSEASAATVRASSATAPIRPVGILARVAAATGWLSTKPGRTALTRMPCGAPRSAGSLTQADSAARNTLGPAREERDLVAAGVELAGDRGADPLAGCGDQGDLHVLHRTGATRAAGTNLAECPREGPCRPPGALSCDVILIQSSPSIRWFP